MKWCTGYLLTFWVFIGLICWPLSTKGWGFPVTDCTGQCSSILAVAEMKHWLTETSGTKELSWLTCLGHGGHCEVRSGTQAEAGIVELQFQHSGVMGHRSEVQGYSLLYSEFEICLATGGTGHKASLFCTHWHCHATELRIEKTSFCPKLLLVLRNTLFICHHHTI